MGANNKVLAKNPETLTRVIDSNAVVISINDDYDEALKRAVYIFNDTGTLIWELINGKNNKEDIVQKLCLEYEVTPQEAAEYAGKFMEKLAKAKLIGNFAGELR